jgi:hypothetical protein
MHWSWHVGEAAELRMPCSHWAFRTGNAASFALFMPAWEIAHDFFLWNE